MKIERVANLHNKNKYDIHIKIKYKHQITD